jgi:hypothetical protein
VAGLLRGHGMLPAEDDDRDWEALCAPLRPAPIVLPPFTPPVPPPELAEKMVSFVGGMPVPAKSSRSHDLIV